MTELEYFAGLILLIIGLNLGYREARKGLQAREIWLLVRPIYNKITKTWVNGAKMKD